MTASKRSQLALLVMVAALTAPPAGSAWAARTASKPTAASINATWRRWQHDFKKAGGMLWSKPATGRVLGLNPQTNTRLVLSGNRHGGITKRVQSADGQQWETQISPQRLLQWGGYSVRYHDFKAGERSAKKYGVAKGKPLTRLKLEGVESTVIPGRPLADIWGDDGTTTIVVQ